MAEIKKVLITGATGRIGRDLCARLDGRFEVYAGVRREVDNLPRLRFCQIREFDTVLQAMDGIDGVIHLAGQPSEYDVYEKMIPDNVTGCYNVFEAARQAGVRRVVFASTNHVIGHYLDAGEAVDEDAPVRPDSFYGVTKSYGEALGRWYAEARGVSAISARIGWFLSDAQLCERIEQLPPERRAWAASIWISHRDMAQFMTRCLEVEDIVYEAIHCTSGNSYALMDLSKARRVLGYEPEDDSARIVPAEIFSR